MRRRETSLVLLLFEEDRVVASWVLHSPALRAAQGLPACRKVTSGW